MISMRHLGFYTLIATGIIMTFAYLDFGAGARGVHTTTSIEIHYSPNENLETIDAALLSKANKTIDIAAYVLTDWKVLKALTNAALRGVRVRVLLDGSELHITKGVAPFSVLVNTPNVEIKVKPSTMYDLMNLKSYEVDGKVLRTGSANFSASGLKQQDNDLIVIESLEACEAFKDNFERMWSGGSPL